MRTIEVVGGVQALADQWSTGFDAVTEAQSDVNKAGERLREAEAQLRTVADRLQERVGANVPMRVFQVCDYAVIVEAGRMIRRIRFEDRTTL